ncbi:hypothetical protein FOZ60_001970 [Perkinsus olseni]|uniref:Uncharacterized protein n=1 Tax=Perkinsus olseni TaxID=32597 RepID=A0A7J6P0D7_PEROL|nr:hypothetical protein FOZ60_001970 [Perkinsus olseni]
MSVVIRSVPRGLLARQSRRLVMTRGFCTAGKEEEKQSEEGQQKENKSKDVGNPINADREFDSQCGCFQPGLIPPVVLRLKTAQHLHGDGCIR